MGLAATEDIEDVGGPVHMVDIMAATEGIVAATEDIAGIMAGRADIMAEAISTGVPASTSVGILGTPTIRTGIILPLITIHTPITIRINRMPLPSPPAFADVASCPGRGTRVVPTPPQSGKERR